MATRLGHVLYWTSCVLAAGWLLIAFLAANSGARPTDWSMIAVAGGIPAVTIWLIGRAIRYVLTAK